MANVKYTQTQKIHGLVVMEISDYVVDGPFDSVEEAEEYIDGFINMKRTWMKANNLESERHGNTMSWGALGINVTEEFVVEN